MKRLSSLILLLFIAGSMLCGKSAYSGCNSTGNTRVTLTETHTPSNTIVIVAAGTAQPFTVTAGPNTWVTTIGDEYTWTKTPNLDNQVMPGKDTSTFTLPATTDAGEYEIKCLLNAQSFTSLSQVISVANKLKLEVPRKTILHIIDSDLLGEFNQSAVKCAAIHYASNNLNKDEEIVVAIKKQVAAKDTKVMAAAHLALSSMEVKPKLDQLKKLMVQYAAGDNSIRQLLDKEIPQNIELFQQLYKDEEVPANSLDYCTAVALKNGDWSLLKVYNDRLNGKTKQLSIKSCPIRFYFNRLLPCLEDYNQIFNELLNKLKTSSNRFSLKFTDDQIDTLDRYMCLTDSYNSSLSSHLFRDMQPRVTLVKVYNSYHTGKDQFLSLLSKISKKFFYGQSPTSRVLEKGYGTLRAGQMAQYRSLSVEVHTGLIVDNLRAVILYSAGKNNDAIKLLEKTRQKLVRDKRILSERSVNEKFKSYRNGMGIALPKIEVFKDFMLSNNPAILQLRLLCLLYLENNDVDKAIKILATVRKNWPKTCSEWCDTIELHIKNNEFDKAVKVLKNRIGLTASEIKESVKKLPDSK